MKILSRLAITGAAAAALIIPSTAALASTSHVPDGSQCRQAGSPVYSFQDGWTFLPPPVSICPGSLIARTSVTDRPDGGNGTPDPYWADDTFTRTLTITRTGGSQGDYSYTAVVSDTGTFRTIKGELTPNQGGSYVGKRITKAVAGQMEGYEDFTFTASSLPSSSPNLGVVTSENDYGSIPADSTSTWYELAFPSTDTFGGGDTGWSWSYTAGHQHWVDALSNGYGDEPQDGNISG